ncbi:hypothetical protein SAMN04489735_10599 [Aneurinibacillus thermoaerophilus]|jgi:hypothetical protein|uniref:Uncharacterized protein n=1 Tax=Aneurinibacillus thermoaerophilus TaxID=143495 RepID=A0A1G8F8Z4_ANETH|nr:hypothetical protein SAMN04489735_10599 [Aneurinibacillus thermoaerophilus]
MYVRIKVGNYERRNWSKENGTLYSVSVSKKYTEGKNCEYRGLYIEVKYLTLIV